jgi:hypothetical protein
LIGRLAIGGTNWPSGRLIPLPAIRARRSEDDSDDSQWQQVTTRSIVRQSFQEMEHASDRKSGPACIHPSARASREGWTCNVEMNPWFASDEFFQELGGRDGASPSSFADIFNVTHLPDNLVAEEGMHRHGPDVLTGSLGGLLDLRGQQVTI